MTSHKYDHVVHYQKLVRDRIPEHIAAQGKPHKTHVADPDEYRVKLQLKLKEEVAEYCANPSSDDLADVLEVIYALAALDGATPTDIEGVRQQKATQKGGFSKRIILEWS